MKTVEYLSKLYVVEGSVGAPDGAIFLDTMSAEKLVELRNILTSGLDLGRPIKMFQSKAKGIKLVIDLLLKWDVEDFDDDLPEEMQPAQEPQAPMEPEVKTEAPTEQEDAPQAPTEAEAPKEAKVRAGSKQAVLIDLLKRPEGASIKEIASLLGWQNHTVRGAISRDLKKRLGLAVTKSRVEGRGHVYRITS